jgi:hypothetical protein
MLAVPFFGCYSVAVNDHHKVLLGILKGHQTMMDLEDDIVIADIEQNSKIVSK